MRNAMAGLAIAVVIGVVAYVYLQEKPAQFDAVAAERVHVRGIGGAWLEKSFPEARGWRRSAFEVGLPHGDRLTVTLADRATPLWTSTSEPRVGGTEIVAAGIRKVEAEAFFRDYPDAVTPELQKLVLDGEILRDYYVYRVVRAYQPVRGEPVRQVINGPFTGDAAPEPRSEIGAGVLAITDPRGFGDYPGKTRLALQDWMVLPRWLKPFDKAFARLPEAIEVPGDAGAKPKITPIAQLEKPVWRFSIESAAGATPELATSPADTPE